MIDCVLVGFNDYSFDDYIESLRVMGREAVSYRDANLSFIDRGGERLRALDILNKHGIFTGENEQPLDNSDFIWPVITYLGSYLARHGLTFDYIRLFHRDKDRLAALLRSKNTRSIAITTTVYVTPEPIVEIVEFVREVDPEVKIIIGGPFLADKSKTMTATSLQDLLEYLGADFYVFSAEGEGALKELISALKNGTEVESVSNIAFRKGDSFVTNLIVQEFNSLEDNMVDYRLFSRRDIGQFVSVRTAKSCPFACAFCGFPERAGRYKYLSLDYVEKELDAIRDVGGVTTITFIDDTFNVPKGRFKEMLRLMIRKQYGFRWNSYLRSDHVDEEALELMAQSGCEGVFLGVESGSGKILQNMAKASRPSDYRWVIDRCRALGIVTYASMIVGFPGEDQTTVQESIDFLDSSRPNFYRAQVWYADPITPIYRNGGMYSLKGEGFAWSHETMTAFEAADIVEKMFLTVKGSRWLPQNGFEPWSLYYLQRRGMKFEHICRFLDSFNDAVAEKLRTGHEEASDARFEELVRVAKGEALDERLIEKNCRVIPDATHPHL
ncbi:PhpK family radical SAM P-methyltransferase [Burkholderia sp. LMG 21824]|uniref:PhpK family radical SAM P-methyltransferase n=1 Tax=Burkholderia sp. LMG 21824 TaxID=3158172 RepID=UPI003C2EEE3C